MTRPSLKVKVNSERLVRGNHKNLVIGRTRRRRLSGCRGMRGLSSHKSLLRERIGKHSGLRGRSNGGDRGRGVLSPNGGLRLPHLAHLW